MGDSRQEGTTGANAHAHPHQGLSCRDSEDRPELCFRSIRSDKVRIQLAEKLLKLQNLQKRKLNYVEASDN